jgi:hypothetical protein
MWSILFNYHVIAFIIVVGFAIYLHFRYRDDEPRQYEFQGLEGDDYLETIEREDSLHRRESKKPTPTQNTAQKPVNGKKVGKKVWKYETRCREIIEEIYGCKFTSARPDFLKSPVTKKNLELDCYNARLKIALEYDGSQHAQYNPHFHRGDKWKFVYQVRKDDWKNLKCEEHGVTLIRVPHYIKYDKLEAYIKKKLQKTGKL